MDINLRLEKLERENRRMKKIGIVAAVVVSAFIIGGQAKTSKVVEANEFRLVDPAGKIRPKIFFPPDSNDAKLLFQDADGNTDVELGASPSGRAYLNLGKRSKSAAPVEHIYLETGIPGVLGPSLTLGKALSRSDGQVFLSAGQLNAISTSGSARVFTVTTDEDSGGPSVTVTDKEGYFSVVGRANLETVRTGRKDTNPGSFCCAVRQR